MINILKLVYLNSTTFSKHMLKTACKNYKIFYRSYDYFKNNITCTYIIKCYACKIQYIVNQSCALLILNLKWKRVGCDFLVCHNLLITVFCFYKWVRNNWTSQPVASIGCWKEVKESKCQLTYSYLISSITKTNIFVSLA